MTDDETPEATPLAAEIHARFLDKMKPGGSIDRVLKGGEPIEKQAPASDEEIARTKYSIGVQLAEYEQATRDAAAWWNGWVDRNRRGFRATRRVTAPLDAVAGEGEMW